MALSQSNILFNAAGIASFFPLSLGLVSAVSPSTGLGLFGFKSPKDYEGRRLAENLLLCWTSRDLFMGVTSLTLWYLGDRKAVGVLQLGGCLVAISDGIMSQRQIGKDAWKHFIFVPVCGFLGAGLLGWLG